MKNLTTHTSLLFLNQDLILMKFLKFYKCTKETYIKSKFIILQSFDAREILLTVHC